MTERAALECQKPAFTLPDGFHYLNCAYMSPLSRRVQEAGVAGVRRKAMPAELTSDDFFDGVDDVVQEAFLKALRNTGAKPGRAFEIPYALPASFHRATPGHPTWGRPPMTSQGRTAWP